MDERDRPGEFVVTGSQNFLLRNTVSQSLAGRAPILHLLPFSHGELSGRTPKSPQVLLKPVRKKAPDASLWPTLFTGFYPRIHDKALPPQDWLGNCVQTYVERDVRMRVNVVDLEVFGRFLFREVALHSHRRSPLV